MAFLKNHFERAAARQLKRGKITQKQFDGVQKVLADPKAFAELRARSSALARTETPKAIGDGKILQWISDHFDQIMAFVQLIIKLFGL